jgi:hypothetical protein
MTKFWSGLIVALAVLISPVEAMPTMPQVPAPDADSNMIIKVATKSQKAAARRTCRAQYGSRLAYVTFSRNRYVCHFRKSTKKLTNEAARSCRKSGMRLSKVNSIRIKGSRSITRFTCKRR